MRIRCPLTDTECQKDTHEQTNPYLIVLGLQFKSKYYDFTDVCDKITKAIKHAKLDLSDNDINIDFQVLEFEEDVHIDCSICQNIQKSSIQIFEMSDWNPNVMIEFGFSLGLNKKPLLIKSKNGKKLPTDLSGLYRKSYDKPDDLVHEIGLKIVHRIRKMEEDAINLNKANEKELVSVKIGEKDQKEYSKSLLLVEARKKHTTELRNFLKGWYDNFPLCERATESKITTTSSTQIRRLDETWHNFQNIEDDWRYQDLIQYHLPKGYEGISIKWEEYKEAIDQYGEIRHRLYEKIKRDVINEIPENLNFNPNWNGDHIISIHFIMLIYSQCVAWIRDDRLYADMTWGHKQNKKELRFGAYGLAKGTQKELLQAKTIFEKMMFDEIYLTKYKMDIIEIIKIEQKLEEIYKNIKTMIEKLMAHPFLPGNDCEYLKDVGQ